MAFLIVEEKGQQRRVPIRGKRITIGRAPDNDVVIEDDRSSRHHAVVEKSGERYLVRDLKSLNGVFLDDMRVREQPLEFGVVFRIGDARFCVESEDATAFQTREIGGDAPAGKTGARASADVAATVDKRPAGDTSRLDAAQRAAKQLAPATGGATLPANAFAAFDDVGVKGNPAALMRATAELFALVVGGVRVCLARRTAADAPAGGASPRASQVAQDAIRPEAFANFITGNPRDELPADFVKQAAAAIERGKPVYMNAGASPARAYIPLKPASGAPWLIFIEREGKTGGFPPGGPGGKETIETLQPFAMAATAIHAALTERGALKERIGTLERELAASREELQRRVDLQTAELSRLRGDLGARTGAAQEFRYDYSNIVGRSAPMREVLKLMDRVTDLPMPVLITGESGTGKDLIARALHENSRRSLSGTFVAVNCAALPETLLESELFGYVKGAFTGADRDKAGLFETAHEGTIFLDEVGETTPAFQAKLLRVLEDGEYRPVGSNKVKNAAFRLVCATNRPLEDMVRQNTFRQDLYYRINVINIKLPSLRERREDVLPMVEHFLKVAAEETGELPKRPSSGVMRALMEYHWPGNVRELENEVKRMVALAEGRKIAVEDLSPALRGAAGGNAFEVKEDLPLKELVEEVEKRRILEILQRTAGNKSKAAELLGLSRLGLRKKMERYGLE